MPDVKTHLLTDEGNTVSGVCPLIISASRSTDIPALYADWFIHRLEKGYCRWINSFNPHLPYYISFEKTRAIVFWSKNPSPIIPSLDYLDKRGFFYYFQFTLNDYEKEGFEPGLPSLEVRIATFIRLSNLLGKGRVIWRFDPVLLTSTLTIDDLVTRIQSIGDRIFPYTKKFVFSFVETRYAKVKRQAAVSHFRSLTVDEKQQFISGLLRLNQGWNISLASCADEIEYSPKIEHNKCIDDQLLRQICTGDEEFIRYLDTHTQKDPGQRPACRCIRSKDIGQYDTCIHGCVYCYASDHEKARINFLKHKGMPDCDTITGEKPASVKKVNNDIRNFYDL